MFGSPKTLLTALLFLTSGCVATATPPGADPDVPSIDIATGAPLWDDPQTTPHPSWGWPTLSWPATGAGAPASWAPVVAAPIPATISGLEHVARGPTNIASGAGIAAFGQLVVVPGFDTDTRIVSLADPAHPTILSTIPGRHRGAATIAYPTTGRLVAVFATNSNVESWDITDPSAPFRLPTLVTAAGSHKVGVVPGTPIVYNANTDGQGAGTDIFDLTNPDAPVTVKYWRNGYGCHHVYFWITAGKQRGICAGVQATQLWNVADPRNPTVIATFPVHHGNPGLPSYGVSPVVFSHFAGLSRDGTVLIVGDETGGGAAMGCDAHAQALGHSVSGPLGDLYLLSADERTATLQGWFNPGIPNAKNPTALTCTAHHGRLVPDPEGRRDLLAQAFYGAGVVLVDFTDPANPLQVDQWASGTDTWEAWYDNGYIVTGDLARGVDVLKLR
jgi:hypothetical protein